MEEEQKMKKFKICTIFIILIIFIFSLTSHAGSIDVELLYDDEAMVFVGRIDDFTVTYEEQNYLDTIYNITLTPTVKIKGDVVLNEALSFQEVSTWGLKLEKEKEYFFGKLKDELYIWELDSYRNLFDWEKDDYKEDDLILKERHNGSIEGGIQKFLNDGSFYEAEKKRVEKLETESPFEEKNTKTYIFYSSAFIIFILLLSAGFVYLKNQKRRKQK